MTFIDVVAPKAAVFGLYCAMSKVMQCWHYDRELNSSLIDELGNRCLKGQQRGLSTSGTAGRYVLHCLCLNVGDNFCHHQCPNLCLVVMDMGCCIQIYHCTAELWPDMDWLSDILNIASQWLVLLAVYQLWVASFGTLLNYSVRVFHKWLENSTTALQELGPGGRILLCCSVRLSVLSIRKGHVLYQLHGAIHIRMLASKAIQCQFHRRLLVSALLVIYLLNQSKNQH